VRLSAAQGPVPLLAVDRVGALATLYGTGAMAYVGGGYGRSGLHSVLEPAAWGVPVAFGPRWRNSRDAGLLLEAGAATALAGGQTAGIAMMVEIWERWLIDDARRREQGARAAAVVAEGCGAAGRSADMLVELISSRPPRT
jgi:3-deoxy-D-manno-octulosonic-acid transferase